MPAPLVLDPRFRLGTIDRRLFGSFVEHLGRAVYGGIYEPGHPTADDDGYRRDVIDLVRELGVSVIRYPGGNFVSGFRWEDSVGPKESRPRRLDLAWHSLETNQVGLHEFAAWAQKVNAELMYALNLGTRGIESAVDVVEYANIAGGTTLSDARRRNGREEPFGIRMWCLGNEMDGPWQLGHMPADDYGKLASRTAKALKQIDPGLELIACGSSHADMPTFGSWERAVLLHAYEDVDFVSCHAYYEELDGDAASFLASAVGMDRFIESVVATADAVRAELGSDRTMNISFDEWNVWYQSRWADQQRGHAPDHWPHAPRLLEDSYSVLDAVVVGNLLMSLLRHADRVRAASLAQLVNVIAPIMTEPGGRAWRQTTFFPFALTSRLAVGDVLEVKFDSPTYESGKYGEVPVLDAVATHHAASGRTALFLVNRSLTSPMTLEADLSALGGLQIIEALTLADSDRYARNTLDDPERVQMQPNASAVVSDQKLSIHLPAVSWSVVALA